MLELAAQKWNQNPFVQYKVLTNHKFKDLVQPLVWPFLSATRSKHRVMIDFLKDNYNVWIMSETKKEKENFMVKKEIFDKIAMQVICHSCKIVPRNSPIYQSETGKVLCSICKPKSKFAQQGIHQSAILENLLFSLSTSCK